MREVCFREFEVRTTNPIVAAPSVTPAPAPVDIPLSYGQTKCDAFPGDVAPTSFSLNGGATRVGTTLRLFGIGSNIENTYVTTQEGEHTFSFSVARFGSAFGNNDTRVRLEILDSTGTSLVTEVYSFAEFGTRNIRFTPDSSYTIRITRESVSDVVGSAAPLIRLFSLDIPPQPFLVLRDTDGTEEHFEVDGVTPYTVRGDIIDCDEPLPVTCFAITPANRELTSPNVFDWNTTAINDIRATAFYITQDPDSDEPLTELIVPVGSTQTFYIVGPLYSSDTVFSNIGGAQIEVTNNAGELSFNLVTQQFSDDIENWPNNTFNSLTESNDNVGEFTQLSADYLFTPQEIDLNQINLSVKRLEVQDTVNSENTTNWPGTVGQLLQSNGDGTFTFVTSNSNSPFGPGTTDPE